MSLLRTLIIPILIPLALLTNSCMEQDPEKKARLEEKEAIREERRLETSRGTNEYIERKYTQIAERKAEAQAQAEAEKAQREAERIAKEERIKELAAIEAAIEAKQQAEAEKEANRLTACRNYKGTTFETLTLKDGTEYKDAKVTSADAIGVSIMYEHGLKRIPFTNLPDEIGKLCHYDPEAATRRQQLEARIIQNQYATMEAIEELQAMAKREASSSSLDKKPRQRKRPHTQNSQKGSISAHITSGEQDIVLNNGQNMRIHIKPRLIIYATSNVEAVVYLDNKRILGSVTPGKTRTLKTSIFNKNGSVVTLRDRRTGAILAKALTQSLDSPGE
ncbi:hypothetical protein Rhal01_03638 [Rubritalea halochordaticola]|uniref:Uncharacterized protein n=1 Tax=Rubritalea halochordaticola TaxID=714537 RepID=A0ABP9V451_9BACT